jgi:hypothetical protein
MDFAFVDGDSAFGLRRDRDALIGEIQAQFPLLIAYLGPCKQDVEAEGDAPCQGRTRERNEN